MRAPADKRSDAEIVEDIIELFDDNIGDAIANGVEEADARASIEVYVRATIRVLRASDGLGRPVWGYRQENVKAITALRDRIEEVQTALRGLPNAAAVLLFALEERGTDDRVPAASPDIAPRLRQRPSRDPRALHGRLEAIEARCRGDVAMLARLRARCDRVIAAAPGKHGNVDYRKEQVAGEAWDFLRVCKKRAGSGSSQKSLFFKASTLFFEAMTGEHGVDLSHACRTVFQRRHLRGKKNQKIITD
jgi:hypothetical protein